MTESPDMPPSEAALTAALHPPTPVTLCGHTTNVSSTTSDEYVNSLYILTFTGHLDDALGSHAPLVVDVHLTAEKVADLVGRLVVHQIAAALPHAVTGDQVYRMARLALRMAYRTGRKAVRA